MRVFLTGASGTGKTSVGKILADRLNLDHMPSVSRQSPFKHGSVNAQRWIQQELVEVANDAGVHDRTLIDVYGYNQAYGQTLLNGHLLESVAAWASTDPIVIYFPILFNAVEDGVRPTDKDFNITVDASIKTALDVFLEGRYVAVGEGTAEERADDIYEYIQGVTH